MRQALGNYPWPGNVRELRNAVERAVILATEPLIAPLNLPAQIVRDLTECRPPRPYHSIR